MSETERIPCENQKCKAMILPSTAAITGGLCMPCYKKSLKEAAGEGRNGTQLSYYGGLGAGKGWWQTYFLISPQELRSLLSHRPINLFITNSRLECNYSGTSLDEYISDYSKYTNLIFSGQEFNKKEHYQFPISTYISLLIGTEVIKFEEFADRGKQYKNVVLDKPPVMLAPCMVSLSGKTFSLITNNEKGYFGLALQYPKVYFTSKDGFTSGIDTEGTKYHKLYIDIASDLKSFCRNRRFAIADRLIRLNLLISDSCMEMVNQHWYLRSKRITVT